MIARTSANNTKLPPAAVLQEWVNKGYGRIQIAAHYNVSLDHMRITLRAHGIIAPRSRDPNASTKPHVMTLYVEGNPISLPRVSMISDMEKYLCPPPPSSATA
jgi:hypothetical protein